LSSLDFFFFFLFDQPNLPYKRSGKQLLQLYERVLTGKSGFFDEYVHWDGHADLRWFP
jgi:hypothetical protein